MHNELRVRWSSLLPLLPDFHGAVRFRIDEAQTRVIVSGRYAPPGGLFGAWFDRLIGARIAHATMRDLAQRIAADLSRHHAAWCARPA